MNGWRFWAAPSTSPLVVMAQLIGLVAGIAIWAAIILYTRYAFRRFGPVRLQSGDFAPPWPRGARLALFWFVIVLSVILLVPAGILAVGYALGMTQCNGRFAPSSSWGCSPSASLVFLTVVIGLGLPLMALWVRFLLGVFARNTSHDD